VKKDIAVAAMEAEYTRRREIMQYSKFGFREHVGMTAAAWIARARVREAQRLLETTTLSVEGVAERAATARQLCREIGSPQSSVSVLWRTAAPLDGWQGR
jgi:hypothetical protein